MDRRRTHTRDVTTAAPADRAGAAARRGRRQRRRHRSECEDRELLETWVSGRDPEVRAELAARYDKLAQRLANGAARPGDDPDDLLQVARIGLLEALDRYRPDEAAFTTFAWATITGLIKRYRRQQWGVHVPRAQQERWLLIERTCDEMTAELRRTPTPAEMAAAAGLRVEDADGALAVREAGLRRPGSLDAPNPATGAPVEIGLEDPRLGRVVERAAVRTAVSRLAPDDQQLVRLRFFQDLSQDEIASRLGVSQMWVSRRLARVSEVLHARLI